MGCGASGSACSPEPALSVVLPPSLPEVSEADVDEAAGTGAAKRPAAAANRAVPGASPAAGAERVRLRVRRPNTHVALLPPAAESGAEAAPRAGAGRGRGRGRVALAPLARRPAAPPPPAPNGDLVPSELLDAPAGVYLLPSGRWRVAYRGALPFRLGDNPDAFPCVEADGSLRVSRSGRGRKESVLTAMSTVRRGTIRPEELEVGGESPLAPASPFDSRFVFIADRVVWRRVR